MRIVPRRRMFLDKLVGAENLARPGHLCWAITVPVHRVLVLYPGGLPKVCPDDAMSFGLVIQRSTA
ncbi:hypothetical protein DM860_009912 [Cuscuta australis]|uniref:Uncharacterized protein n=1 Tax=Cuscuta australis TaxID=267555 RepID=A0A328DD20_9ASTE|nr:hypothetical protein DM860_009912 [Cuscuta australis]